MENPFEIDYEIFILEYGIKLLDCLLQSVKYIRMFKIFQLCDLNLIIRFCSEDFKRWGRTKQTLRTYISVKDELKKFVFEKYIFVW